MNAGASKFMVDLPNAVNFSFFGARPRLAPADLADAGNAGAAWTSAFRRSFSYEFQWMEKRFGANEAGKSGRFGFRALPEWCRIHIALLQGFLEERFDWQIMM